MTDMRFQAIESRISALEVHKAVDAVHRTNVEGRLGSIEDALKWLVRLVFGALILAVVGFLVNGGFSV